MQLPARILFLLAGWTSLVGAAVGLSLGVASGQLALIDADVVAATFADATAAAALPIPATTTLVDLVWSAASPATFTWTVAVATLQQLDPTAGAVLVAEFSVGAAGSVPLTPTALTANLTCLSPGTASVTSALAVTNTSSGAVETLSFALVKTCPEPAVCDLCAAHCPAGVTCDCDSSASNAVCTVHPTTTDTAASSVDNLRVLAWNTNGLSVARTDASAHYTAVAASITAANAAVVALFQVYTDAARDALVAAFSPARLTSVLRQVHGGNTNGDSGYFLASEYTILLQSYSPFPVGKYGVLAATLEVTTHRYLQLFVAQVDSSLPAQAQLAQAQLIHASVISGSLAAATLYPLGKMEIVLMGGLDAAPSASAPAYDQFVAAFGKPRDLLAEANNASAEPRLNWAFAYNNVTKDQNAHVVDPIVATVDAVTALSASSSTSLSLDFGYSNLAEILIPSLICGLLFLAIVFLIVMTQVLDRRVPAPEWARVYARQSVALMKKNWLTTIRNRRALVIQLIVPFVFLAILSILQYAYNSDLASTDWSPAKNTSTNVAIKNVPRCSGADCISLIYTNYAGSTVVDGFMNTLAAAGGIPASEILTMSTAADIDAYLLANPEKVMMVIYNDAVFGTTTQNGLTELVRYSYSIQYNYTVIARPRTAYPDPTTEIVLPVQHVLEQAVLAYRLKYATGQDVFSLQFDAIKYPHPQIVSVDVLGGGSGAQFFLGCLMFNFVIQMGQIVGEREMRLREAMAVVGLSDVVYWGTWVITNVFWNTISAFLLIAAGAIFQFKFFLVNDFGTYFFLFFLFGLAMVPFAIFISLFLSKARTATSAGFAIYLIGILALSASNFAYDGTADINLVNIFNLIPFMALSKGMQDLGSFATGDNPKGLRWADRFYSSSFMPLTTMYNWLIIEFFFYLGMVLVYDFFLGGTRGESRLRSWITRCSKKRTARQRSSSVESLPSDDREPDVVEEERRVKANEMSEAAGMQMHGLEKVYYQYKCGMCRDTDKDFRAVDGTYLHIDDKQLFCLLGHNGAGKSTTISMLTGLLAPTGGDAVVFGKSLQTQPEAIRAEMGVCPQFDILWRELTGAEHIELFCALKGVPSDKWKTEAASQLEHVGMTSEANVLAAAYSGGQKRRLSVAIALVGSPRVVYLDEPTTGMDPVSRRQVWELLEREKRNRMIILTTHSMEEADMLGDRIAIMKEGKIKCIGSSLHLKNRYGAGYRLTVVGQPGEDTARIENAVQKLLPTASLDYVASSTLHYEVPYGGEAEVLPAFLREVETRGAELGIVDVQVGMTSLEDVFLRVAGAHEEEHEDGDDKKDEENDGEGSGSGEGEGDRRTKRRSVEMRRVTPRKAWSESNTDPSTAGSSSSASSQSPSTTTNDNAHASSSDARIEVRESTSAHSSTARGASRGGSKRGAQPTSASEGEPRNRDIDFEQYRPEFSRLRQLRALVVKSATMQLRLYKTNLCQIIFPLVLILIMFAFQFLINGSIERSRGALSDPQLNPPVVPPTFLLTAGFDPVADCPPVAVPPVIDDHIQPMRFLIEGADPSAVGAYGFSAVDPSAVWASNARAGLFGNATHDISQLLGLEGWMSFNQYGLSSAICISKPFLIPVTFQQEASATALDATLLKGFGGVSIPGAYTFRDVSVLAGMLNFGIYYNDTISNGHDLPIMLNFITSAAFRVLAGGDENAGIVFNGTRDYPTPSRANDFDFATQLGPYFYIFILQLYFPVILGGMVYEKEFKLREIMRMMGLKTEVYWLVRYTMYYILYLIAILIMVGVGVGLQIRYFTINDAGSYIVLILLWGHTMVAMAFLFASFFSNSKTATVAGYVVNFAFSLLSGQLVSVYFDSPRTAISVMRGLMILPPFALYEGLTVLRDAVQSFGPGIRMGDVTATHPLGEVYIYLALQWLILLIMAVYCEAVIPDGNGVKLSPIFCFKPSWWCAKRRKQEGEQVNSDTPDASPEVTAERERAWSTAGARQDMMRLLGMRKVFPKVGGHDATVAVNNLSMTVAPKECLGMLGPNGAGKSTIINLMCGFFPTTAGTARIADLDISTQMDQVHLNLGVCPQDNLIWDELTSYEHLVFYGTLKGISDPIALREEIEHRLTQVELWKVRDKRAGRYSGGMKRRLSVAIALIGTPPVLLLDEPTTGLDPKARNNLWDVVRDAKRDSCLLLTTHSMEEAEALCERVGIFVTGNLMTIGTPAQLKKNFGDFFKLTVTVPVQNLNSLHRRVVNLVPNAQIFNEPVVGTRIYQLPQDTTRLSELFAAVAEWAPQEGILDWGISNVSLEEVFLRVTSGNPAHGGRTGAGVASSGVASHSDSESTV